MKQTASLLLLVATLAFATGCVMTPKTLPAMRNEIPIASPDLFLKPPDESYTKLIIFNTSSKLLYGRDRNDLVKIYLNGKGVTQLYMNQYVQVIVPRGKYKVDLVHWDLLDFSSSHTIELDTPEAYLNICATIFSNSAKLVRKLPDNFVKTFVPVSGEQVITVADPPTLTPIVNKTPRKTKTELMGLESPPDTGFGKYYALVIGNNNYQHLPKLRTAQNDAKVVAQILGQNYGYRVHLLLDARRADILIALGKFRETLTENDNLLIYYAGHGWLDQEGNEGYWLPVDAVQDNEVQWVSNASITTVLKAMPAKHVLIVADSCYSGKLARGLHIKRKTSDYFARMASKRARSVIASGGLEPVSDSGGKGDHSIFATAFIEALKTNQKIIDGTELFTQIRRPVIINSDQTPEYADIRKAGHEGGDFLFVRWK